MINKDYLIEKALSFHITVTQEQAEQFNQYAQFLVEYNQKVNLTAITDPEEIVVKHFIDSLLLTKVYNFAEKEIHLADIGTGAGFPGIPVKILFPQVKLTLLDSLQKRIVFLEKVGEMLSLENVKYGHIRAEDAGKKDEYREKFDIVTARAVADLPVLCEYCLPLVKVRGSFVAMKGSQAAEEIEHAAGAIATLGGKLEKIDTFSLTGKEDRTLISIKKISQTSPKYPRNPAKIKKKPI